MKRNYLIFHPFFILGVALLILNDAFFKWEYSNALTGKLSDFAGLLILPIFLAHLFPKCRKYISVIVGIGFVFWKSPYSTPIIDWVNGLSFLSFNRVVDYTDLVALAVLPMSHWLINRSHHIPIAASKLQLVSIAKVFVLMITSLSIMATSLPRTGLPPEGDILIDKKFKIKTTKKDLLNRLVDMGYQYEYEKADHGDRLYNYHDGYYKIDSVLIHEEYYKDTIKQIIFAIDSINENKVKVHIINVTLMREGQIQDWKELRRYHRWYKKKIKKGLIKELEAKQ